MGKIYGLFGAMTGKVADAVMVVRNGEQIVRKYQPIVSNPSTPAQVAARAKLKLMSQLAAVFAPVIAIPSKGSVSSRNLFVKKNYGAASFSDGNADVALANIKVTQSVLSLPEITANRVGTTLNISLNSAASGYDKVVYMVFARLDSNELRYVGSKVEETAGEGSTFATEFLLAGTGVSAAPVVIYGYGIRINSEQARAMFSDLTLTDAATIASVITSRSVSESDLSLSETKAVLNEVA